jgi:hypothetical protein
MSDAHDTLPPSDDDEDTIPGGRRSSGPVPDLPDSTEAVASLLRHLFAGQNQLRAQLSREREEREAREAELVRVLQHLADQVTALSEAVRGRPCMRPREPEPPCLHAVGGER